MPMSPALSCPRCKSEKHTSLPFGTIVRASGTARTYRCLVCGFFFVRAVAETPFPSRPLQGDLRI